VLNAVGQVRKTLQVPGLVDRGRLGFGLGLSARRSVFTGIAMAYGLKCHPDLRLACGGVESCVVRLDLSKSLLQPLVFSLVAAAVVWMVKGKFAPSWVSFATADSRRCMQSLSCLLMLLDGRVLWNEGRIFLESVLKGREGNSASQIKTTEDTEARRVNRSAKIERRFRLC
jgi:hypothetical protein